MIEVQKQDVQGLIDKGAQIVEVLGAEEFEEDHLPSAINIPLRKIDGQAREMLDPNRPVLVYCWDSA
jgi:rhodanese-related sulfurtransferase